MIIKRIKDNILVQAFVKLVQDGGLEYAGNLAYLNIFSLFPLFIILGIIIGMIVDSETSAKLIIIILSHIPTYSDVIKNQIQEVISGPSVGSLSIASIGAIWTTTSSFEGLRTTFNKIYKVKNPPFFIKSRLLSILHFFAILLILIATILGLIIFPKIFAALEAFMHVNLLSILDFERYNVKFIPTLIILFVVVAALYYSFTNKKITIMSVLPGSALTTILWTISAEIMGMSLQLQLTQMNLVYGSLSGILIVLLFFYIANVILLYGAAFNYLLNKRFR